MASPVLVHGPTYFSSGTTVTSNPCTLANTPAAGNKLFIGFTVGAAAAGVTITDNGSTPSGWTLVGSQVLSTVQLYVFSKVSSGDENTITVSWAGSTFASAEFMEWSGGGANETVATGSTASAASPVAFGPVAAPSNANAVPLVFLGFRKGGSLNSWSTSGAWSLGAGGSANDSCLVAYQTTPPNAAVSGTIAYTGTGPTGSAVAWLGFFLDPPASASNSASISGAMGAFGCVATVSAALAAAVAGSLGPNAAAATANAANAASLTRALGNLSTSAQASGLQTVSANSSFGAFASALSVAQQQALAAASDFGPLSSSLTVHAVGGVNTATVTGSLGSFASTGTVNATGSADAASSLTLATQATTAALGSASASSALSLATHVTATAYNAAQAVAGIGPLASVLTVNVVASTLPPNPCFYLAMPYRCWYAVMPARDFYLSECC